MDKDKRQRTDQGKSPLSERERAALVISHVHRTVELWADLGHKDDCDWSCAGQNWPAIAHAYKERKGDKYMYVFKWPRSLMEHRGYEYGGVIVVIAQDDLEWSALVNTHENWHTVSDELCRHFVSNKEDVDEDFPEKLLIKVKLADPNIESRVVQFFVV